MSEYYLGNGSRRPRLADYRKEFGFYGHTYYTMDLLRYEQKQAELKRLKEVNKKASEYASGLGWGILPPSERKNKR